MSDLKVLSGERCASHRNDVQFSHGSLRALALRNPISVFIA